jgi:anti-sigma regulatory factor (Ser/Thr protein kinase)
MDLRVVIAGGDKAAGYARRVLAERLSSALPVAVLSDLQLLVTEIVANSVRHGGVGEDGEIDLRVDVGDERVRVEMRDTGIQADPKLRTPDLGGGGGFGMLLVSRMSERWGVEHEPNVVMWFELALSPGEAPSPRGGEGRGGKPNRGPLLRYSLALNSQIAIPSIDQPEHEHDGDSRAPSARATRTTSRPGRAPPRLRRDVEVVEHEPPHRVDGVGQRVEPVEERQPARQVGDRKSTPEMKNSGMMIICITPMNDCICLIRPATITPKAVIVNASSSCRPKMPRISSGS